jgi:uncharacterized protein YjbI with pentapeptide repeats
MKFPALVIALSLIGFPALAQNAGQIARVQAGESCPRCNLFQADLSNKSLKGHNYAGARLRQADLSLSVFSHGNFAGGDLRDLNGYGALFGGANFTRANMTNSTFVGAFLEGASFRGATLSGVNFSGAEMDKAVGLSQGQLNGACGDLSTTLAKGLHLPVCK